MMAIKRICAFIGHCWTKRHRELERTCELVAFRLAFDVTWKKNIKTSRQLWNSKYN